MGKDTRYLRTSEEWMRNPNYINYRVVTPDGWPHENFDHAWYQERIPEHEFQSRLARSSIKIDVPGDRGMKTVIEDYFGNFFDI